MEAAVSLSRSLHHHHAHGALPLPLPAHHHQHQHHGAVLLPAHHHDHHGAVPLTCHSATVAAAANAPSSQAAPAALLSLAVDSRPRPAPPAARSSSRAATGYAAALADACARAGTLRRAARHARALLLLVRPGPGRRLEEDAAAVAGQLDLDARVAALVRMLVAKGKPGMVAEALAEFAAICDHLLPPPPRARHAY